MGWQQLSSALAAAAATLAAACVLTNTSYDGGEGSTSSTSGIVDETSASASASGQISTTLVSGGDSDSDSTTGVSAGNPTIDGLDPGSASASTSSTSTTGGGSTSDGGTTGEAGFSPMTLRNYNPETCWQYFVCVAQQKLVPAVHDDTECFTPAVDGPLYVSRVGINVELVHKSAPLTVDLYAYDPGTQTRVGDVVASRIEPAITQAGYREVFFDPPVLFDEPAFCVSSKTGDGASQVMIPIDVETPGGGLSFVGIEATGMGCDLSLRRLEKALQSGSAHWCINADIQPTP